MTRDEISLGFRMVAMGRPNQEAAEKLIDALAVLLASPEERLASVVQDAPADPSPESADEAPPVATPAAEAPRTEPAKRGRPRKDAQ